MHGFICMDSKTLSHGQQLQRIESHIEESFHSALLHVLALSLCIFIRSPYMSSFISPLETTESQNLLAEKCWGILLFFPLPRESLWLEKGPARVFSLWGRWRGQQEFKTTQICAFIFFFPGPRGHKKSGELICSGRGRFATAIRYAVVLRMLWVGFLVCLSEDVGSAGRRALSGSAPAPVRKLTSLQISPASLHWKGSWGDF